MSSSSGQESWTRKAKIWVRISLRREYQALQSRKAVSPTKSEWRDDFRRRYHKALQSAGGGDRNYRGLWGHLFIQFDRVVHWRSISQIRRVLFSGRIMEHTFICLKAEQRIDWMKAGETRIFRSVADRRMRPIHLVSKQARVEKSRVLSW